MLVYRSAEEIVRMIAMYPQELSIDKMREQLSFYKLTCAKWVQDNTKHSEIVLKDDF